MDPNISFPYVEKEKVPNSAAVILSLVAPGVIIAIVCLVFVPGPTVPKDTPKALIWRRKLWELNTGWLGLALAVVGAIFFTQGMKNLFGKPRPDLLSRCDPDLANIEKYAVGGLGSGIPGGIYLVDWHICREPSLTKLNDGFASFFSGHSACMSSYSQKVASANECPSFLRWTNIPKSFPLFQIRHYDSLPPTRKL